MSPIIRLSDLTYNRLESKAIGFDTPSSVIERLLDFYDSQNKDLQKFNSELQEEFQHDRKFPISEKRPRDPEKENKLRKAVGKALEWGKFKINSKTILEFDNPSVKVLCKYSSYSSDQNRWFWGVGHKYWSKWDNNFYLALLMENEDQENYSFLLLKPDDASFLFTKCSEHGGEKKINLRFYNSDGLRRIQEWQDFNVEKNIHKIDF